MSLKKANLPPHICLQLFYLLHDLKDEALTLGGSSQLLIGMFSKDIYQKQKVKWRNHVKREDLPSSRSP